MKNLFLFQHFRTEIPDLTDVELFCTSSQSEEVLVYSSNTVYKLSTHNARKDVLFDMLGYYSSTIPKIIHMSCNSITDCICLAFENGDILTLDVHSKELECVGCVEGGVKAVQWSPDQEVIVIVTGLDTVLVMTGTFYPVIEVDLYQNGFGEKQFITVGWGKKETQFHGSEGKAAARAVSEPLAPVSRLDDGKPWISWRGDGSLFAVNIVRSDTAIRQIRIFSRDGILQYTSESAVGLEGALSWRPSGNLIATSQRLPNKHVIAFFEKNGLRHGEFSLPFGQSECTINQLSWNSESSILAIWSENVNGNASLQLWTTSNYHWYLKQSINFSPETKLLAVEWDMLIGNRLHILYKGGYICYDWGWTIYHSLGNNEDDGAFVAVVDGAKLLLTSFRQGIVPPPMCSETLKLDSPVNSIMFAPPASDSCSSLCAILCDGTAIIFKQSPTDSVHMQSMCCELQHRNAADFHHWLWIKPDSFLCCYTQGVISYLVNLSFDVSKQRIEVRKEVPVDGVIVSMVAGGDGTALIQLNTGALFAYQPNEDDVVSLQKSLPETCETLRVCQVDDKNLLLGLSTRNRLYVDGEEVANNVTSVVIHSEFILLTTLKHELLCVPLNKKGLQLLIEGKCGPGRRIEHGARLVTSVPGDTRVLLQMPRGNLECIQPRPLTLHVATVLLDRKRYRSAFELLRKNRINLNLLCDYRPEVFLANVRHFIDDIKDPSWLSLFLSELEDENIVQTMYKNYYSHLDKFPEALTNKVEIVCDTVRKALLGREDTDQYLLPVLTSFVKKRTDKDLAEALLKVKAQKDKVSADEALKYLLYLVDVNHLYDVALGLYDFDLVMLVVAKSNKDPKEYLPFLNKLRRLEPNYCRYVIDKHLKRYRSALDHIALCPENDRFEECLNLVKSQKLYSQALELFSKQSSRYLEVASLFGDYLMEKRQYYEAGVMYTRAENHHNALTAYLQVGSWRDTVLAAKKLEYKENKLHELCQDIVSRLKSKRQYREAAEVLIVHMGDMEESIVVLVQGKLWDEAVWLCSLHDRMDMIETHVKPGLVEHLRQLSAQLGATQEQFTSYKNRLNVVREIKKKRQFEEKQGDIPEDCDLYSDTSSVMMSLTGSRATGRSSRSSKNRRKQERKMLSLKEGSPYEEYALIRELHQLITNAYNTTDEVVCLCRVLLKFEKDKDAADLQKLLTSLLRDMDSANQEIWITDLMQQSQMGYGPDATVNNITARMQTNGPPNPGLALLEPHLRFPPASKNCMTWQIDILNDI